MRLAAAVVAALALASPASASSGCSSWQYALYWKKALPGNGQSVSVTVKWNTSTLHGGHVAAWVGPVNSAGTVWIQAGVAKDDGYDGVYRYVEWNYPGAYSIVEYPAKAGVAYKASVKKVADGKWTASIGGTQLGKNVNPSGMSLTEFVAEAYVPKKGVCQLLDVSFSSSSWKLSGMTKSEDKPYKLKNPGSNGWQAKGS